MLAERGGTRDAGYPAAVATNRTLAQEHAQVATEPIGPEPSRSAWAALAPLANVALYLVAAGYLLTALLTRQSGRPVTHTMWAEDGAVFLRAAYRGSGPEVWFQTYAGYLHLIPRLIAELAVWLPAERSAVLIAATSALVATGCVVLLALGLKQWLPHAWMQAALIVAIGSVRALGSELDANAANLHWFTSAGMVGLLLVPIRRWSTGWAAGLAMLVLGLTDYLAIPLVLPVLLVFLLRLRLEGRTQLRRLPIVAGSVLAGAVQLLATVRAPRVIVPLQGYHPDNMLSPYVSFVLRGNIESTRLSPRELLIHAALVVLVVGAAVIVRLLRPLRPGLLGRIEPSRLAVAAALAVASPVVFAASVLANQYIASRYAGLPAMLLVAALIVLAGGRRAVHQVLVGLLSGALLLSALLTWNVGFSLRSKGPDWADQVRTGHTACANHRPAARIYLSPPLRLRDGTLKWWTDVPCSEILP